MSAVPPVPAPPGAEITMVLPKFEYEARAPARVVAATEITPEQFAGEELVTFWFSLPAATTNTEPRLRAPVIAAWNDPHAPPPPSERLSTLATFALAGTPETLPPDAHVIASTMSDTDPPHLPS